MISVRTQNGAEVDANADPNGATLRQAAQTAWTKGLPTLNSRRLALRDLRATDAPALHGLADDEGARFTSPASATADSIEDFIAFAQKQRSGGRYACFAVVSPERDTAVGMFQLRLLDKDLKRAEWDLVLASATGRGLLHVRACANAAVRL